MLDDIGRDRLERAKAASVSERLFRAARRVDALALARIRAATGVDVRPAHTSLLPHLDHEGVRLTELARRTGVTKQAIGPLIDDLERWGAVERVTDPSDGRAKLVRFRVVDGDSTLLPGLRVLAALEQELRAAVGQAHWDALDAALDALLDAVDGQAPDDRDASHRSASSRP